MCGVEQMNFGVLGSDQQQRLRAFWIEGAWSKSPQKQGFSMLLLRMRMNFSLKLRKCQCALHVCISSKSVFFSGVKWHYSCGASGDGCRCFC